MENLFCELQEFFWSAEFVLNKDFNYENTFVKLKTCEGDL